MFFLWGARPVTWHCVRLLFLPFVHIFAPMRGPYSHAGYKRTLRGRPWCHPDDTVDFDVVFLGDNILYWKGPAVFLTHPVHQTPWSKLLLLKYPGAQGYLIIVSAHPVRRKGSPHMSRFRLHLRLTLAFLIYVISFAFWIRTFLQWTYNSKYLMPESVRHVVFRINGRDSKMFWGLVWFDSLIDDAAHLNTSWLFTCSDMMVRWR